VWWTLRIMGYPNVFVLDGGLKAWRAEGRVIETDEAAPAAANVISKVNPALVADRQDVTKVLADGAAQVVDARSSARFRGEVPEPRASLRSGHMPGALNVPFNEVVAADGTLKPVTELQAVFAHVDLNRPIITTCGSGVTAAVLALALARLGRPDVAIYDGSWTEWGGHPDTVVVTGA
jgi:thiosulfate/3-mercaptopyruvate sulfurtransferase